MINFIQKPIVIIASILLIGALVGGYIYFSGEEAPVFVVAKKQNLSQEINVTGRVKPSQSVDLAFEKGGRVAQMYVIVGSKVGAGQTLVSLDNEEISAQLAQTEAEVKIQEANLNELRRGARPEEIQVQEIKVANAKTAIEDAKNNFIDKLQDAYTKSDDAVRAKTDQMFTNPQTQNPQLKFLGVAQNLESDIEWRRLSLEYNVFPQWKTSLNKLTIQSDLTTYISEGKNYLDEVKIFLEKLSLAVNNPNVSYVVNGSTQEIPSSFKTDTATARINVNTAIGNVTTAEEKLKKAQSDLDLAKQELTLKKSGATEEQIIVQEAQLEKAKAQTTQYRVQLSKTFLRSPINGIIVKQEAKTGEIVSANAVVVSLISEAKFEVEANVPEADIAKIKNGSSAKITLDAYGRDVIFEAKVSAIEPAETIIDGVATYKTTFQFAKKDERIKSGMTANIDIIGEKRENVIAIPQRAIIRRNGDQFARKWNDKNIEEIIVKTGLRGSGGNIEIIEGINEGDRVIIF